MEQGLFTLSVFVCKGANIGIYCSLIRSCVWFKCIEKWSWCLPQTSCETLAEYSNTDENKRRNKLDSQHETQYVPTVPANPQLNPECDRVWETREQEEEEEEETEEEVWERQKKPGEKWSAVCVCVCVCVQCTGVSVSPPLSLHHDLWGRQPVREQEAEETGEVWVCECECVRVKDEWAVLQLAEQTSILSYY